MPLPRSKDNAKLFWHLCDICARCGLGEVQNSSMVPQGHLRCTPLFACGNKYPRAVRNGPLCRESAADTTSWVPGPRNSFFQKARICAEHRRRSTETLARSRSQVEGEIRAVFAIAILNERTVGSVLRVPLKSPDSSGERPPWQPRRRNELLRICEKTKKINSRASHTCAPSIVPALDLRTPSRPPSESPCGSPPVLESIEATRQSGVRPPTTGSGGPRPAASSPRGRRIAS